MQLSFSKIYLAKSVLPFHARVVAIFDTVEDKTHQYEMDNLYKSYAFFKATYNKEKKY